ncbi:outer envelope pore protein 21B [Pyrus ussuriensis x Pyrus communis]|uniref:Outer envelope pore protein 21B n=1 Tax=Pyrus ussuriensis x Pyrus communis TaxID=2448454 RepID=A0A5N5HSB6_9ROSA|nr:outer envelope pore protein 21B [Pyrus ussuriensis x Pyrus communis]
METSLRYGGDAKALRIHAKQKLPLYCKTHLQILELEFPLFFRAVVRRFYPDFSASLGVGLQYDKREKLHYTVRGKKSFPGRCNLDKEFKERNSTGAAEFSWSILNFQKDQDARLKLGYDLLD